MRIYLAALVAFVLLASQFAFAGQKSRGTVTNDPQPVRIKYVAVYVHDKTRPIETAESVFMIDERGEFFIFDKFEGKWYENLLELAKKHEAKFFIVDVNPYCGSST